MSSSIQQEYEEGIKMLGFDGVVFFKFINMFSAKGQVVRFGPKLVDSNVSEVNVQELRDYIKEQREWVRTKPKSGEISRRMWWLVQKIFDMEIFNLTDQKFVIYWFNLCDNQLTTSP